MEHLHHIIHYQELEVTFKDRREGLDLSGRLSFLYRERILPAFEQIVDETDFPERRIRIDRLELDVGRLNAVNWENELVEKTIERFKTELQKKLSFIPSGNGAPIPVAADVEVRTIPETHFEIFFNFLKTGVLPGYSQNRSLDALEKAVLMELQQNSLSGELLKDLFLENLNALKRFLWQGAEEFINKVMKLTGYSQPDALPVSFSGISKSHQRIIENCICIIEKERNRTQKKLHHHSAPVVLLENTLREINNKELTERVKREWLDDFLSETQKSEEKDSIAGISAGSRLPADSPAATQKNDAEDFFTYREKKTEDFDFSGKNLLKETESGNEQENKNKPAAYYISNAGLVICHPWLISLSKELGYWDDKTHWKDREAHQKALFISQFLITGKQEIAEFELPLNKILLGYPLAQPVERAWELLPAEREEAEQLLNAIIKHWQKLKNTSIEGLREAFLQRDGKLTRNEKGWLLQVEQKTIDILMDAMPWMISRIKNEAMKETLFVEW